MGEKTGIEWCDHTFNPWWGCTKVSPACANCYAETLANRFPNTAGLWGPDAPRKIASEKVWNDPIRWNRAAEKAGVRRRVFCASMADVFEDRHDLDESRSRLFALIRKTPSLAWLLLTKRPEHVRANTPPSWWLHGWPPNVWMGTTAEDQEQLEERGDHLLRCPASVRFVSAEPLLGPLALWAYFKGKVRDEALAILGEPPPRNGIDWVILGGESGHGARTMQPEWARSIRDQCATAGVPFFFKQWGEFCRTDQLTEEAWQHIDSHENLGGGYDYSRTYWKTGKKLGGSRLDGEERKAFPEVRA